MLVLVTGGSGFIGSRLVRTLSSLGCHVRVLSRKKNIHDLDIPGVEFYQVDLLDPDVSLAQAVSGCTIIFNCAGELSNEEKMQSLHVDATARLVSACKEYAEKSNGPVHWVQLSSVGAYGPPSGRASNGRIVTEDTVTAPVGIYEITKTLADELVVTASEDGVFSYSILRPSNVYGTNMPNSSLRQLARLIKCGLFFYVGAPGAVSTYVHVQDVVSALVLCGFSDRAKGEIFNISNDCPQTHLVNALATTLDVAPPRYCVPEWLVRLAVGFFSIVPGFPVSRSRVDALVARTHYPSDKLVLRLGYNFEYKVSETIGEVVL